MSVPGNINPAPPPSSFDNDPDFYEESRWAKLKRRITEEPLIPLGCALTCWALYEATKSMRSGDKHKTNRMFRRRIYAQGFTVLAMLGGSIYWETDRSKRKEYHGLLEEKRKKEKHDAWIRELEEREREEEELRRLRDRIVRGQRAERREMMEGQRREEEGRIKEENVGQGKGGLGGVRCALEVGEGRGEILRAVRGMWDRRR